MAKIRLPASATLRHHWPFILIAPLIIIIMTWPTALHVFDASSLWLPGNDPDIAMKLWDAWYGGLILAGQADFYFTDLLFYPSGASLVYHHFNLPHMLLLLFAQIFLPATNAYSLCFLLTILANAAAAYVYLNYLFRDRWLGLFGSMVFALSVFVIAHPEHPDLNLVAAIPLVLYFMQRAFEDGRARWMALAGLFAGVTAFTSIYILVCLVITVAFFTITRLKRHWTKREFWLGLLLLLALSGSISLVRLYPMMRNSAEMNDALAKSGGREHKNDLLATFVHPRHPLADAVFSGLLNREVPNVPIDGYLGYVSLALAAFALLKTSGRRDRLLWLALLLIFLVLRLGSQLKINGIVYEDILLPKFYLDRLFPLAFESFRVTSHFQVGVLLPMAVLASAGLMSLVASLPGRRRLFMLALCLLLVLLETYAPIDPLVIPRGRLRHLDWLRAQEQQDEIRLINVAIRRHNAKHYGFLQSLSGYPHVEGLVSRPPADGYAYISENPLLDAWQKYRSYNCFPANAARFNAALDQLKSDGFSHIVFHYSLPYILTMRFGFLQVQPAYEDGDTDVYRIDDMRANCGSSAFLSLDVPLQLQTILPSPAVLVDADASALSVHPSGAAEGGINDYYRWIDANAPAVLPFKLDRAASGRPIWRESLADVDSLLADKRIVLYLFDPRQSDPAQIEAYASWLASRYNACGRNGDQDGIVVEYFAEAGLPCGLLIDGDPLHVRYDNEAELANLLLQFDGERLDAHLLWRRLPAEAHGYSIQFFDEDGAKTHGQDGVIHHVPYIHQQVDLSSLKPGDYLVKLVLYNFETGAAVSGVVASAESGFERLLEFGRVTIA